MKAFSDLVRGWQNSLIAGLLIMGGQLQLAAADSFEPILEINTKGTTEKDCIKEEYNWFRDHLLLPQSKTWGSKTWAPDAKKFAEAALLAIATEVTKGRTLTDMSGAANKLIAAGCDDPLICYLAYKAHANWRGGEAALDRATQHMPAPATKGALIAMVALAKVELEDSLGFGSVFVTKMVEGLKQSLTDDSYDANTVRTLLRHHMRSFPSLKSADAAVLQDLKSAYEKSSLPEWARCTLAGDLDIQLAWKSRGSGWADTVTQPGWEDFSKYLKLAREELERSWKLNPASPEAAARMITVTMGESTGPDELIRWFDRATTAQLDCPGAYNGILSAFKPRWGGSFDALLRFAVACARTKRFDTEVPAVFWRVCEYVGRESGVPEKLYADKTVRETLKQVQEGYLAEKSTEGSVLTRHASMAAVAAHFATDASLTKEALAVVGASMGPTSLKYLNSLGRSEARLRLETRVALGEFGPEIAALMDPGSSGNGPGLKTHLDAIKPAGLKPEASGYVEDRRLLLEFAERFNQGGWIPLPFHSGLTLFSQSGGKCSATPDGALVFEGTDEQTFAEVVLRTPVTSDCEIKGEFEVVIPKDTKIRKMTMAGPVIGFQFSPMPESPLPVARGLVLVSGGASAVDGQITGTRFLNRNPRLKMVLAKTNRFHLGVFQGKATFDMNGAPFATDDALANIGVTSSAGMAGFCTRNIPVGGKIVVRNLEIRKSTAAALDVMK